MSAVAVALAVLSLQIGGAEPNDVHHVLVLDDSGSMETDFDVHGFALAVPQLFQRLIGHDRPERLTVLTLPQGTPIGPVRHLGPADYLRYDRDNGTFYAKAIVEAIRVARASTAKRVEIALVTDAEPNDMIARTAIDQAGADDPRIRFSCFQLGTDDPGDLCVGRTQFARDGFDMARLMASHLAASFGSIPQWGRVDRVGAKVPIPLGRFVSRLHVLLLGARAGEDFEAALVTGGGETPVVIDHTRPMMTADMLLMAARTGPKLRLELPIGPRPRLALGTLSLEVTAGTTPELVLKRAEGPVAWGVILEYDLEVELVAPRSIAARDGSFEVRAHLVHDGVHVDDLAALKALGLEPKLDVARDGGAAKTEPMTLGADGWATLEVPAPLAEKEWSLTARFVSPTADLRSHPAEVVRESPGKVVAEGTPTPSPSPAPALSPSPAPAPSPALAPSPSPAPSPAIGTWLTPTLSLPEWAIEGQTVTYTLTVTTTDNEVLSGDEIRAQSLTAVLVIGGDEIPMMLAGDRFEVTRELPLGPSAVDAQLVLRHPGGEVRSAEEHMDVLPDAIVRLAPRQDLGTVEAGCGVEEHCRPLDLSSGQALERTALKVTRNDPFEDLRITLQRGEESFSLERDRPVELGASADPISVCFAPPSCTELPDDVHAEIYVSPADLRLATPDRSAATRLVADVTPSTWLACNLWWCLLIIGTLLTLFIIWGYVRPHAFPSGALIQVADQERRLARDPGRPLRSVPQGRRGFYRTATCAIDPSGFTVKRSRPHVLQLKADRGRIALMPRGAAVERRQRGKWVAIDRRAEPFVLSGATYRVNQNFVFRVLA